MELPLIATNWSGPTAFMTQVVSNYLTIDCRPIEHAHNCRRMHIHCASMGYLRSKMVPSRDIGLCQLTLVRMLLTDNRYGWVTRALRTYALGMSKLIVAGGPSLL